MNLKVFSSGVVALVVALATASASENPLSGTLLAQNKNKRKVKTAPVRAKVETATDPLVGALQMAKEGKYQEASIRLFQLSQSPRYRDQRMQIKYILGLMLYQMKLNQVSAFQFISVVKDGNNKHLKQALEKLSLAADALGDDTLLNYAIAKIEVDEFPKAHRDMLYFRIGEFQLRNQQFETAAKSFNRVGQASLFYPTAKYKEGLAYAEAGQLNASINAFTALADARASEGFTDSARVAALMGRARSLYQQKNWDDAIAAYREVPRDTESWHDTLFESSWAMLQSGRFRSAVSNFQSIHSAFYEEFYLPESLLLRAIVYLYICKYDEMGKVLDLYNRIYKPVYKSIDSMLSTTNDPVVYFNEVVKVVRDYKKMGDDINREKYRIPLLVARRIFKEGDFQTSYNYIRKLLEEKRRMEGMSQQWKSAAIGKYSKKVVQTRLVKARKRAGRQVQAHLEQIKEDLFDLFEQEGFIRYEMINGRKESLKKKIAGKDLPVETDVDAAQERDFYIQNGYEYWPFKGEYWLDELGNYHYVGVQSCE